MKNLQALLFIPKGEAGNREEKEKT